MRNEDRPELQEGVKRQGEGKTVEGRWCGGRAGLKGGRRA